MTGASTVDDILRSFATFAPSVDGLALYERLTSRCSEDRDVAALLTVARPGQARPVLLLAAVHDLVLREPQLELARWYQSVTPAGELAHDDPWPVFRSLCMDRRAELEAVISTRSTQTNEVNRAVFLAPLLAAACRDVRDAPISLVELGTSAGLLLGMDRYRVDVGGHVVGDASSPVRLAGELRGGVAPDLTSFPPVVRERVGIDLDPVSLDDPDGVRWLQACVWPDQPLRVARFRAAVDVMRRDPPMMVTGDFVEKLSDVVDELEPDTHLVVFNGWALTYVNRSRRPLVAEILAECAASGRPVSWATAEPPGCVPGIEPPPWMDPRTESTPDTVLGLRRWREAVELAPESLGWSHPHGDWFEWIG